MFDEDTIWNVYLPDVSSGWIMTGMLHNEQGYYYLMELESDRNIKVQLPQKYLGTGYKITQKN